MAALLRAPQQLGPLLEAGLEALCAGAGVSDGALFALGDGAILAAVVYGDGATREIDPAALELLLTQGIAGYAVTRGSPVLLRDIGADPRWGPPALEPILPTEGAAFAVALGEPACAVLVLVSPEVDSLDDERMRWAEEALVWLEQPLQGALNLDQALRALDRMDARDTLRRDLSAMALHDMRNPLQNIQLAFRSLERLMGKTSEYALAEPSNDLIRMGMHSAAQLSGLSKTLLDVSRLEDEQLSLSLLNSPISDTVTGALGATGVLLESSGCQIETHIPPILPAIPHDPALIERVVVNLIDNAIKHTPPEGTIALSVAPYANGVCVRVADSGPGIPPELREEIFAKYFQIRPQGGARLDGVGLGLAFCRMAISAHGGEIWAENGHERGAVFAFTLPGPRDGV